MSAREGLSTFPSFFIGPERLLVVVEVLASVRSSQRVERTVEVNRPEAIEGQFRQASVGLLGVRAGSLGLEWTMS